MSYMMISDLPVAVALGPNDKFEIEQVGQLESTHLTITALLAHIDNTLLTTVKSDIDAIEVSIGGSGTSLAVVEGRVSATESNITALQAALAQAITDRTNADAAIAATVTTVSNNLAAEVTARTNADNALDTRLDTAEDAISGLTVSVGNKAPLVHTHVIADVTGLVTALAGKEPANANIQAHIVATNNPHSVTKTQVGLGNVDNTSDINKPVSTAQQTALDAKAATVHTHTISAVTGLQAALDGKATTVHTHVIGDVTGLQTALDGKAATAHTHAIADTTGLQAALDAKDTAIGVVAGNLANEVTARQAIGTEVANARGAYADLDARLDNLAVSAGATGPQGPAGATGATGPQGPAGATGPQGLQGIAGEDGAPGATGPQGPEGPQGPQGEQGPEGEQGPIGPIGPQGEIGPEGPTGGIGPQGPAGPAGDIGPAGPEGEVGPIGPQGEIGETGPIGPSGRIPVIQTVTNVPTLTPTFADDLVEVTAQAQNLTLANFTGTAIPGLGVVIYIKAIGAYSISYGTEYRAVDVVLPTTTVSGKVLYLAGIWNAHDTKFDVLAVGQER